MKRFLSKSFLILALAASLAACGHVEPDDAMYSRVKSVNKLVLGQMAITKMATVDDIDLEKADGLKQTAAGILDALKLGKRRAAYSYDTYLRAYINLDELRPGDISIDHDAKTIKLTLPPVRTEFDGRDIRIREEHYRVTGLRSNIDARERAEIKEAMNTELKKEVQANPRFRNSLEEAARAKGRVYFTNLLSDDGYTVTVEYR